MIVRRNEEKETTLYPLFYAVIFSQHHFRRMTGRSRNTQMERTTPPMVPATRAMTRRVARNSSNQALRSRTTVIFEFIAIDLLVDKKSIPSFAARPD
jgi:hypothetical protein